MALLTWRQRVIGIAALVLLFALAVSSSLELASDQNQLRNDAKGAVVDRVHLAAAAIGSLFLAATSQPARPPLSNKTVTDSQLPDTGGYYFLLDDKWHLIAKSKSSTLAELRRAEHDDAAGIVRSGSSVLGLGDYEMGHGGPYIPYAAVVQTHYGKRYLLTTVSATVLSDFFRTDLRALPGASANHAYIIDEGHTVIGSTNPSVVVGHTITTPSYLKVLKRRASSVHGRYIVRTPITGTTWNVVVSAPYSTLFAPISGIREALPWLLIGLFCLATLAALYFLLRLQQTAHTLREANVKLTRAAEYQKDFVASASHELRTPIATIMGYTELALHSLNLPAQAEKWLEVVLRASRRLRTLIDDLITVDRIEGRQEEIEMHLISFRLRDIMDPVIEAFTPIAASRGIELRYEPLEDPVVICDPDRYEQAVSNLISNAVKFTETGSVTVRIRSQVPPDTHVVGEAAVKDVVYVKVFDTGPGISDEDLSHIFQRFYRSEAALKKAIPGTGLGLYITFQLITMMGGEVLVRSHLGEGSMFAIGLPVSKSPAEDVSSVVLHEAKSSAQLLEQED